MKCPSGSRACKIVGWSHRAASRLITPPSFREQGTQPDPVRIPRFCMLPWLYARSGAMADSSRPRPRPAISLSTTPPRMSDILYALDAGLRMVSPALGMACSRHQADHRRAVNDAAGRPVARREGGYRWRWVWTRGRDCDRPALARPTWRWRSTRPPAPLPWPARLLAPPRRCPPPKRANTPQ